MSYKDKLNRSKDISTTLNGKQNRDKFATADSVMNGDNDAPVIKEKVVSVAYSFPESYLKKINDIILKCMLEGVAINKSEIIRIGILMVNELSVDEIKEKLESVSVPKGRR